MLFETHTKYLYGFNFDTFQLRFYKSNFFKRSFNLFLLYVANLLCIFNFKKFSYYYIISENLCPQINITSLKEPIKNPTKMSPCLIFLFQLDISLKPVTQVLNVTTHFR